MTDTTADLITELRAAVEWSRAYGGLEPETVDLLTRCARELERLTATPFAELAPEALDEAARTRGPAPDPAPDVDPNEAFDWPFVRVYTDGACSHGGVGGWAWWVSPSTFDSGAEHFTTNNQMELWSVIEALTTFRSDVELEVVSDSAYVVSCLTERWFDNWRDNGWRNAKKQPVENRELWEELLALVAAHRAPITWTHTRGHGKGAAEHKHGNGQADRLAVAARLDFAADHDRRHEQSWRTGMGTGPDAL